MSVEIQVSSNCNVSIQENIQEAEQKHSTSSDEEIPTDEGGQGPARHEALTVPLISCRLAAEGSGLGERHMEGAGRKYEVREGSDEEIPTDEGGQGSARHEALTAPLNQVI